MTTPVRLLTGARRLLLALVIVLIALLVVAPRPAHAAQNPASPTCGYDIPWNTSVPAGTRLTCYVNSAAYPDQTGWYGVAGRPGDCSWSPFARFFPNNPGAQIMCLMQSNVTGWQWANGAWSDVRIWSGTTGYIAPYASGWCWLYVNGRGWVALRASDVGIRW
jgi:hypothetical protein